MYKITDFRFYQGVLLIAPLKVWPENMGVAVVILFPASLEAEIPLGLGG